MSVANTQQVRLDQSEEPRSTGGFSPFALLRLEPGGLETGHEQCGFQRGGAEDAERGVGWWRVGGTRSLAIHDRSER